MPFHISARPPPTAIQAFDEVHDTATSLTGLGVIVQIFPFHDSDKVVSLSSESLYPMAMQKVGELQETACSKLNLVAFGFRVGAIAQFFPFQVSARAVDSIEPRPLGELLPTAMQAVGKLQDTATRPLLPLGLGVRMSFQVLPFQVSASVTSKPAPFLYCPTAMQALNDGHDTAFRVPIFTSAFGVLWIVHGLPRRGTSDVVTNVRATAATATSRVMQANRNQCTSSPPPRA
jgi:hypothetical protein